MPDGVCNPSEILHQVKTAGRGLHQAKTAGRGLQPRPKLCIKLRLPDGVCNFQKIHPPCIPVLYLFVNFVSESLEKIVDILYAVYDILVVMN